MSSMTQSNEKPASSNSERERSKTGRFASKPKSDQATDGGSVLSDKPDYVLCSMIEVFTGPNTRVFYSKNFKEIRWYEHTGLIEFHSSKGPNQVMRDLGCRMTELP